MTPPLTRRLRAFQFGDHVEEAERAQTQAEVQDSIRQLAEPAGHVKHHVVAPLAGSVLLSTTGDRTAIRDLLVLSSYEAGPTLDTTDLEAAVDHILRDAGSCIADVRYLRGDLHKQGTSRPDQVSRTFVFGITADAVNAGRDLLGALTSMPGYIDAIKSCSLRVLTECASLQPWTHVWEQQFADHSGIEQYMMHPFHWAHVDQWFDRDSPTCVTDQSVLNVVYSGIDT